MGKIDFDTQSEPSVNPASGKAFLYIDSGDKLLSTKDESGNVKKYITTLDIPLSWLDSAINFLDLTTSEPVSPTTGDRYINTVTGTSSETSQSVTANYVYEWTGSAWNETVAQDGDAIIITNPDPNEAYTFNGAAWVNYGTTTSHNNLSSLQGGTTDEYYHLTNTVYSALIDANAQLSALHTDGSPTFAGLDLGSGNLSLTGTLGSAGAALADGVTATTQAADDNSTKVATTAYVDSALGAQDTLAEILGNGNTTGGNDILLSGTDSLISSGSHSGAALSCNAAQTTASILSISAPLLTTGNLANFASSSSDVSTRNLVQIQNFNSASIGTTPLYINQLANNTAVNILASGVTSNKYAFNVEADSLALESSIARFYSNSSNTQVRDLVVIQNDNANATEATCLAVYQKGDAPGIYVETDGPTAWGLEIAGHSLTTGKLMRLHSNSSDTGTRNLVEIINDSPDATGATGLYVQQDSTGYAINAQGDINSSTGFMIDDLSIDLTVPGVIYNKTHVSKVDETHINIYSGEANIRKSDGTIHRVSWNDNLNYEVSLGLTIPWVTYEWNVGETAIQLNIRDTLPTTLEELEQIAVIGRVWVEAGVLYASSRHMLLANDRYTNRSQAWKYPSYNYSVVASASSVDSNYIALSTGELFRWPIVAETTDHHTHYFSGDAQITYIWGHLQGQATHDEIEDDAGGDEFDIADIANWYDNGGVATAVPNNKFVIHQIGAYAISEVLVWFRGQNVYDSMAEALSAVQSESLVEAQWASDTSQISKIAWVILKQNTTDFTDTASCRFVTVTGSGTSAGAGVTNWVELTDTPASYSGHGNKIVHLNSGESALEFTNNLEWDNTNSKLTLVTDSLASGYGLNVTSASPDTNQWSLGRFAITNASAIGAAALEATTASGEAICLQLTGGQVLQSFTGSSGIGYYLFGSSLTTGTAFRIEAGQLTTGSIASFYDNSSSVSARNLISIHNDNSLATGATCLDIQQDSEGLALNVSSDSPSSNLTLAEMSLASGSSVNAKVLSLVHNGSNGGTALDMTGNMRFTGTATTATSFDINGNTNTTGNVIDLYGSALTTAALLRAYSNSADASSRSLIEIINDNAASSNTIALDVQQDGNSRGIRLAVNGITTGIGLDVYGNSLTSGNLARFYSDSSSISARNMVQIINDNVLATGTTSLYLQNDANNQSLNILGAGVTSSRVVNIEANSISSGQILRVYSNSSDSTVRALTYLVNDNPAATGARILQMQQDANAISWYLDQNGDGNAIYLDGTGNSTHDCIRVDANNLTTASIARFYSNSPSTASRNLIEIINDNVLADGVVALYVQNDADAIAVQINGDVEIGGDTDMIGSDVAGNVLDIDGDTLTTGNALYLHGDSLTTGKLGYFYSNSADTSARYLVHIINDNAAATGAIPLVVQQDSSAFAAVINGKVAIGGPLVHTGNYEITGRIGIGTTPDADADLHIYAASGDLTARAESASLASTERAAYQVIGNSGSGNIYAELGVVYYDQSGSGGTNGPCAYLHLQAGDGGTNYLWTDNADQLRIGSLGQVGSTNGTVVGTQTSDERLKNIISKCPYGLDEILKLRTYKYKFKTDTSKKEHLGFTAQEVRKVLPEVVSDTKEKIDDSENTKLAMDYAEIIPVLVNAVQEQHKIIEQLKAKLSLISR